MNVVLGTMTFGESVFGDDVKDFIRTFMEKGYDELDTAFVYNEGRSEELIGKALKSGEIDRGRIRISTKVNPRISGRLDAEAAYMQLGLSLERLGVDRVDTFYLHFPDTITPVDSVLEACNKLHDEGMFKELGLSNFPASLVESIQEKCKYERWICPTVYEGIYNPLARRAELELMDVLDRFGMRFYAYNPLAGGLLTGRYSSFESDPPEGRFTRRPNYQNRYWKQVFFSSIADLKQVCDNEDIGIVEAVFRWMNWHSALKQERGDAVIIGASKSEHLRDNLVAMEKDALPEVLVMAFERMWNKCKDDSPEYFRYYTG